MALPHHKKKPQSGAPKATAFVKAAAKAGLTSIPGKGAVEASYRTGVELKQGFQHTGSFDLDAHFKAQEPESPRWDYAVGVRSPQGEEMALWLEPHPASSPRHIDEMQKKLQWLKAKLALPAFSELRRLRDKSMEHTEFPYRWLVTPTGRICVLPNSPEARRLALAGLDQPRRQVKLP